MGVEESVDLPETTCTNGSKSGANPSDVNSTIGQIEQNDIPPRPQPEPDDIPQSDGNKITDSQKQTEPDDIPQSDGNKITDSEKSSGETK